MQTTKFQIKINKLIFITFLVISIFCTFLLSNCTSSADDVIPDDISNNDNGDSSQNNSLIGNGKTVIEKLDVGKFNSIQAENAFTLILVQDDKYKVEVKTDENIQQVIGIENNDGIIYIKTKVPNGYAGYTTKLLEVYVYAPDLIKIITKGLIKTRCNGNLKLKDLTIETYDGCCFSLNSELNFLDISTKGTSTIELRGLAEKAIVNNASTGNINAYEMTTHNMEVVSSNTGSNQIQVSNSLKVTITGVGNVYCKGSPQKVEKTIEGIGKLFFTN